MWLDRGAVGMRDFYFVFIKVSQRACLPSVSNQNPDS